MVDGPVNPLVQAAEGIGRTDEEREQLNQQAATPEPQTGSFEKFMATFGRATG